MHLSTISDEARRPEDEFWAEFEAVRLHILGAALDAVSTPLRNIGSVRLKRDDFSLNRLGIPKSGRV